MTMEQFHDILKRKINQYIHLGYKISREFPKEELYGVTSQLRRAIISIMLNYVEGYARQRGKVYLSFLETAYGSFKESMYLLEFALDEGYITESSYREIVAIGEEIGAMVWRTIEPLRSRINHD